MTRRTPHDGSGPSAGDPFRPDPVADWVRRRQDKIVAEIQRNRRGDYRVPTWVLTAALVAIVAFWVGVIIFT